MHDDDDNLLQLMWQVLTNQSELFQSKVNTLLWFTFVELAAVLPYLQLLLQQSYI